MIVGTVFLEKGIKAIFDEAYAGFQGTPYAQLAATVATEVPSNSAAERFGWLGAMPAVQEWLGDKAAGIVNDYNYDIPNRDWYNAVDIDRNELEDDQLGRIEPRIRTLAEEMRSFKGELVSNFILNGLVGLAYDGAAFFSNRAAPNDNLLAGTGVALANVQADIYTARAAMMRFVTDNGRPMGMMMDTIVCPPELEGVMYEAIFTSSGVSAATQTANPISRWIKNLIVLPNTVDVNDWYGFACGRSLKPLILQNRKDIELVLDDTQVKRNRKLIYSSEWRGNAGYGFFQMGVQVVN
jgi:phage major head subunit gpT-like protein